MDELAYVADSDAQEPRSVPVVRTRGLLAEYTTGVRPSGEWFALGTVRGEGVRFAHPAWLIVGTGVSQEAAVANMAASLELEALRLNFA